jgi:signal transduction histidine kinase
MFTNKELESQLNTEGLDYLTRIKDSGDKLGQLIDGLLDLSRLTRGELKLEKVNMSEIINCSTSFKGFIPPKSLRAMGSD